MTTRPANSKKRGRENSPVPDALLQSALQQASQICGNLGLLGLAGLCSGSVVHGVPKPDAVRAAAFKAYQEQPPWVHWSKSDMAAGFKLTGGPHRLGLQGAYRGYRMARASAGVSAGCYYYECWIRPGPSAADILANLPPNARLGPALQKNLEAALEAEEEARQKSRMGQSAVDSTKQNKRSGTPEVPKVGGNLRIGWSMRTGDLEAPVGYDKWSYAIRDLGGIVHQSIRQDLFSEPFGDGDVMGCAICLDPEDPGRNHVRFFRNGECLGEFVVIKGKRNGGEAFTGVVPGTYYPALSSYMGGSAVANFGPKFVYLPRKLPPGLKLSPMSELCPPPPDYETIMAELMPVSHFLKNRNFRIVGFVFSGRETLIEEVNIKSVAQNLDGREKANQGRTAARPTRTKFLRDRQPPLVSPGLTERVSAIIDPKKQQDRLPDTAVPS
eukprot:scaffold2257_cov169-Amphora_coffeaeformis.AAC.19